MSEIIMREEGELGMWDSALDVFAFGEEDGACLGGVGSVAGSDYFQDGRGGKMRRGEDKGDARSSFPWMRRTGRDAGIR